MSDNDPGGERRVSWARTVADVAVIREMQVQQTATLANLNGKVADLPAMNATLTKLVTKVDQLWDNYQQDQGARKSEIGANLRWRWYLSTAIGALAVAVALIQAKVI